MNTVLLKTNIILKAPLICSDYKLLSSITISVGTDLRVFIVDFSFDMVKFTRCIIFSFLRLYQEVTHFPVVTVKTEIIWISSREIRGFKIILPQELVSV